MTVQAIKERPIIFSAEMVRALRDGRKSQTRRIIKEFRCLDPADEEDRPKMVAWGQEKWGAPGDRLWVRETWASPSKHIVAYRAGGECGAWMGDGAGGRIWNHHGVIIGEDGGVDIARRFGLGKYGGRWRSPIHMPRWASRLTLEIKDVRVERLQDISEADARAEGVPSKLINNPMFKPDAVEWWSPFGWCETAKQAYANLWDDINGLDSWKSNPWVWAISFSVAKEGSHG